MQEEKSREARVEGVEGNIDRLHKAYMHLPFSPLQLEEGGDRAGRTFPADSRMHGVIGQFGKVSSTGQRMYVSLYSDRNTCRKARRSEPAKSLH